VCQLMNSTRLVFTTSRAGFSAFPKKCNIPQYFTGHYIDPKVSTFSNSGGIDSLINAVLIFLTCYSPFGA
jgi:hypothetical protein